MSNEHIIDWILKWHKLYKGKVHEYAYMDRKSMVQNYVVYMLTSQSLDVPIE